MIVAVSMFKDEGDIAGATVSKLLEEGVDHVIVADNLSTDDTRSILESFGADVTVVDDPEVGFFQSRKMDALAHRAGDMGADWIIPFDADEWFYSPQGRIGDVLPQCDATVLQVKALRHFPHPTDDLAEADPVRRMKWRSIYEMDGAKVAYRYHPDARLHMGNHDVVLDGRREDGWLELREFQYRSYEHFVRKVRNGKAAYDATDLPESCGIHWRRNGALDEDGLRAEWAEYLAIPTVYDPAPVRSHADA